VKKELCLILDDFCGIVPGYSIDIGSQIFFLRYSKDNVQDYRGYITVSYSGIQKTIVHVTGTIHLKLTILNLVEILTINGYRPLNINTLHYNFEQEAKEKFEASLSAV
jgi:hypothetical protein